MLSDKGNIKISDFGWAGVKDRVDSMKSTFCGTYDYMAPEIMRNKPYDEKVDVWALGVLLFELTQGYPPFKGRRFDFHQVTTGRNPKEKIQNVTQFCLNPMKYRVSAECSNMIRRILKVDPAERPSISEVLNSEYAVQMSRRFNWDLAKLLKFRRMRSGQLGMSRVSGVSQSTTNLSQSDSFFFDKKMSGFTTLIENKDFSNEKNQVIATMSKNQSESKELPSSSRKNVHQDEGRTLNFEKKNTQKGSNIFMKEMAGNGSRSLNEGNASGDFTIKESAQFDSPSQKLSSEAIDIKLNVFSKKTSRSSQSRPISQNVSQIKGTGKTFSNRKWRDETQTRRSTRTWTKW